MVHYSQHALCGRVSVLLRLDPGPGACPLIRSDMFWGFKYRHAMNSSTHWFIAGLTRWADAADPVVHLCANRTGLLPWKMLPS